MTIRRARHADNASDTSGRRSRRPTPAKTRTRPKAKTRGVTFATLRRLARALPGVEEGLSWGTSGFKVKGRFLARMKEDGESLVLRLGLWEREQLMESAPEVFYITDHYAHYPAVLIRLPRVRKDVLAKVLEESWRQVAPKTLTQGYRRRGP